MLPEDSYQSPFAWRYGTPEMRQLWSEREKRRLWRQVWIALAETQQAAGLVTPEQVADLRAHADEIDLARAAQIEAETHHDVMSEVRAFAEQCPVGGGIIHLGATSMDISDNAEVLRQRAALGLILARLDGVLAAFGEQIARWAETACMGWTHLQPAEPTTVGYRLALYAQDLLEDRSALKEVLATLRGKGFKGATGTAASYVQLLEGTGISATELEAHAMAALGIAAFPAAGQTYPRRQDYRLLAALAGLAGTLYRFAFDLRVLQSPSIGEWSEPFGSRQVGSSAMPFKRNPINAEKLDSLGRFVATLPGIAWDNAAHCLLERTLDDSANRRTILPEGFLAVEEMLVTARRIVAGLTVDEHAIALNMARYGVFAASERVLMAASRAGADRQVLHEVIRNHSMAAWAAVKAGLSNPLAESLAGDPALSAHLPPDQIRALMHADDYVGHAPERARQIAAAIATTLAQPG